MPMIEVKIAQALTGEEENFLQKGLTVGMREIFGKPEEYIMVSVRQEALYLGTSKLDKGAFIAVRMMGAIDREKAKTYTARATDTLKMVFGIDPANVYITFETVATWGWKNGLF